MANTKFPLRSQIFEHDIDIHTSIVKNLGKPSFLFLCLAYASIDDVIQAVKSKEVDGMLLDRFTASYYQSRGKLKSLLTVKKLELQRDAGVLFSQDRLSLAQCLKDYQQANVLKAVQTFTNSYKVTSILFIT